MGSYQAYWLFLITRLRTTGSKYCILSTVFRWVVPLRFHSYSPARSSLSRLRPSSPCPPSGPIGRRETVVYARLGCCRRRGFPFGATWRELIWQIINRALTLALTKTKSHSLLLSHTQTKMRWKCTRLLDFVALVSLLKFMDTFPVSSASKVTLFGLSLPAAFSDILGDHCQMCVSIKRLFLKVIFFSFFKREINNRCVKWEKTSFGK